MCVVWFEECVNVYVFVLFDKVLLVRICLTMSLAAHLNVVLFFLYHLSGENGDSDGHCRASVQGSASGSRLVFFASIFISLSSSFGATPVAQVVVAHD